MTKYLNEVQNFSFGKNWKHFIATVDDRVVADAGKDIDDWLGSDYLRDKSVIDIGSGSGLSSLCMYQRGCRRLVSFDYDPQSVEATKSLAEQVQPATNWEIFEGSILDPGLIERLGKFDIVHSWGVLHHTGNMWQAIENAIRLCAPDALLLISIYTGGDLYEQHLALKRRFNTADEPTKLKMIRTQMRRTSAFYNASGLSDKTARDHRGMTHYHDAIDWLGGLPYEVAHVSEVLLFGTNRGLLPLTVLERRQGGCSVYLFRFTPDAPGMRTRDTFKWRSDWKDQNEQRTLERQLREDLSKMCKTVQRQRAEIEARGELKQLVKKKVYRCLGVIRRGFSLNS